MFFIFILLSVLLLIVALSIYTFEDSKPIIPRIFWTIFSILLIAGSSIGLGIANSKSPEIEVETFISNRLLYENTLFLFNDTVQIEKTTYKYSIWGLKGNPQIYKINEIK